MNSVIVIGNITKDLELRTTNNGISCVTFFIALNNGTTKEGKEIPADFPKVVVYDKPAENLVKYCKKGSKVAVSGNIKTQTWDKEDGTKGYDTYIKANKIVFLNTKPKEEAPIPEAPDYLADKTPTEIVQAVLNDEIPFDPNEVVLSDDELPF